MGLDAVVYKRLEGFAKSERDSIRLVDRSTGELEYVDHKLALATKGKCYLLVSGLEMSLR